MARSRKKIKRVVLAQPRKDVPLRSAWIREQGWCVWLRHDPRSVTAMLHGEGDGREKLYEKYVRYWKKRNPALSEETLHAGYAEYAQYMDEQVQQEREQARKRANAKRLADPSLHMLAHFAGRVFASIRFLFHCEGAPIGLALLAILAWGAAHFL